MVTATLLGASDIARQIGARRGVLIPPKAISDLAYRGRIDCSAAIVASGRRLFPASALPQIEAALEAAGVIPAAGSVIGTEAAGAAAEAEVARA